MTWNMTCLKSAQGIKPNFIINKHLLTIIVLVQTNMILSSTLHKCLHTTIYLLIKTRTQSIVVLYLITQHNTILLTMPMNANNIKQFFIKFKVNCLENT